MYYLISYNLATSETFSILFDNKNVSVCVCLLIKISLDIIKISYLYAVKSFTFEQLAELAKQERNVIKILLLGAGESGKSTLVKQMKIIHSDGFTIDELKSFKPTVLDNILSSMKYVLTGMGILRINLENAKNKGNVATTICTQLISPA
ncbi:guanine nucleotide-binding protein subunit alpha [Trichonephila clavipes]|nr:guanine nucleotide-binding protein subunit alpha [Trichonephila clavipes]